MSQSLFTLLRRGAVALLASVALGAGALDTTDPIGTYRLATVNGTRVPMVWHRVELPAGGVLQLSWIDGTVVAERDGALTLVLTSTITGPGAPGNPVADTTRGHWHRAARGQVEIRFDDGRRSTWPGTDGFRSLTIRAAHADLDGERRPVTLVLVRD